MASTPATNVVVQPMRVNFTFPWGDTWQDFWFRLGTEDAAGVFTPTNLTGATVLIQMRDEESGALLMTVIPAITPLTGLIDPSRTMPTTKVDWQEALYEVEVTYSDNTHTTEVDGKIAIKGGRVANAP